MDLSSQNDPSMNHLWQGSIQQEKRSRALAFDYALGISLIALLPISGFYSARVLLSLLLIAKMLWDIGRIWQFSRGQDSLAIAGNFFGALGAVAAGLMTWLILLAIGIWVPYISSLKGAAGLFTLTWMLGQSTNQYYANGDRRRIMRNLNHDKI